MNRKPNFNKMAVKSNIVESVLNGVDFRVKIIAFVF